MRGEIRRGPWPTCGSCSRALVCPTRHDHGDREQSPGTRCTVPQADICTATRHDLARATSPTPGPHRPPSSARSPPVRRQCPLIPPAMRTVYSPRYLPLTCPSWSVASSYSDQRFGAITCMSASSEPQERAIPPLLIASCAKNLKHSEREAAGENIVGPGLPAGVKSFVTKDCVTP